jgi:hypothetical protein
MQQSLAIRNLAMLLMMQNYQALKYQHWVYFR